MAIGFATITMNASSFKGSDYGASETLTDTGYVMAMSPLVVAVAAAALSPPSPSVAGRRIPSCFLHQGLILRQQKSYVYPIQSPSDQSPPQGQFQQ